MKTINKTLVALVTLLTIGFTNSSHAILESRLNGLAYYDTDLDITWLANLSDFTAITSNHFPLLNSGLVDWDGVEKGYFQQLTFAGLTGWRLPNVIALDPNAYWLDPNAIVHYNSDGSDFETIEYLEEGTTGDKDRGTALYTTNGTDGGWRDANGKPLNELGHMFYVNLPQLDQWGIDPIDIPKTHFMTGVLGNPSPFHNFVWTFDMFRGASEIEPNDNMHYYAWPVYDGDVGLLATVPEPHTYALIGLGLLAFRFNRNISNHYI